MTLKGDAKFKGKMTFGLKKDIRNLFNFHASTRKSENCHFDGLLLSIEFKDLDEKNTEELSFMTRNNDAKLE